MRGSLEVVCLVSFISFGLAFADARAAERRTITHEDVWLMKRLGGQVLSPDGRWIIVSVTEPSYEHDQRVADLWIVPTRGDEPPRRLTAGRRGESDHRFSSDGSTLVFSTRREGDDTAQLYLLPIARSGEAQRLTSLVTGARSPRFSPDGRHLVFVSDVWPGARSDKDNRRLDKERKDRKSKARIYETFPIRHWDRWLDERRPTLMVVPTGGGAPRDLLAGSSLVAGRGYGGRLGNDDEALDPVWTPDGSGLVFVATDNRHEGARAEVHQSLWHVALEGGEPRRLTPPELGSFEAPAFTSDGATLVAKLTPASSRWVYSSPRAVAFSWPALRDTSPPPSPRTLAPGFDGEVVELALDPHSPEVYFLGQHHAHDKLYVAPLDGGPHREVGALSAGTYTKLAVARAPPVDGAPGALVIAAQWSSATQPGEVGLVDPGSGTWTRLTAFNVERAATIDWQPLTDFWFTSKRGAKIHTLVAMPPGASSAEAARLPLLLLIHGGPHTRYKDDFAVRWNHHLLAAPGYVVILPNYSGSTGYGEAFARRIQGDPLRGPGDELNQAIDEAIRRFPIIDKSKLAAAGASYGGHLVNWLAVTTRRFRALVSHAGLFDLRSQWLTSDSVYFREKSSGGPAWDLGNRVWREQSPLYRADKLETPMLVIFGENDFRVPLNNALELWSVLQRQGVESRLVLFPDENHWILKGENSRLFYREVHDWLARFLR